MRTLVASFRIATLLLVFVFAVPMLVGCGGGADSGEPEAYTKDTGPPEEGMEWDERTESWMYSQPGGGGGGYDDGYDRESYDNQSSDNGDEDDDSDSGNSDEVAQQDSDDGYSADPYANTDANPGGNGDGYGSTDPSARPSDSQGGGDGYGAPDPYASASGGGGGGSGVYAEKIEPLFRAHCYNCHGGGERGKKGGFSIHTPEAIADAKIMKQFDAEDSELYIRVSMDPGEKDRMPPEGPGLSPAEVALVKDWIQSGANFGGGGNQGDGYGDTGGRGGRGRDDDPYGDDNEERGSRAPARPKNLAEASSVTFQRGNDLEAMNQLYAQTLVRKSEAATTVLENYRYVPALRRARLAVRWGIGVVYKPLFEFGGAPRPPGVHQDLDLDDDDSDDSDEYADLQFTNEGLDYYTGDIGDEILLRLSSRIERSFYGEILRAELEKKVSGGDDDDDFGNDYQDGYGGGRGRGGRGRGGDSYGGGGDSDEPDDDRIEQIMPGVMALGQGKQTILFERAMEQGLDLVLIIDIKTTPDNRRRIADSTFRVRLFDVATKQQLASTGRIRNLDVQKKRAKNSDDESIILEIDKIFAVADDGKKEKDKTIRPYKVVEFPTTKSEKAKKAAFEIVKRLVKEPKENPLAELSEIRFYESRGLLDGAIAAKAFAKLAPENAAMLAKVVDENELRTSLTDWLVVDEPARDDEDEEDAPRRRPQRGFR